MTAKEGSILLTGCNGGIGVGFVTQLLKSPYATTHSAIYAVRDPETASALKQALLTAPKDHEYVILPVDLCSQSSIRTYATDVNTRVSTRAIPPISAMILNAGVEDMAIEHFTDDGFERTFAVNYLANFLLILLTLQSIDKQHGRIIFLSTAIADVNWHGAKYSFSCDEQKRDIFTTPEKMSKGIEEHPDGNMRMTGQRRYVLSKLLMMMWMYELQRRLDTDSKFSNVSVLALDPGYIGSTGISRNAPLGAKISVFIIWILGFIMPLFSANSLMRTATKNGDDLLRVAFNREAFGEFPKCLYVDGSVLYRTPENVRDEGKQRGLWRESLPLAGIKDGDTVLEKWK